MRYEVLPRAGSNSSQNYHVCFLMNKILSSMLHFTDSSKQLPRQVMVALHTSLNKKSKNKTWEILRCIKREVWVRSASDVPKRKN